MEQEKTNVIEKVWDLNNEQGHLEELLEQSFLEILSEDHMDTSKESDENEMDEFLHLNRESWERYEGPLPYPLARAMKQLVDSYLKKDDMPGLWFTIRMVFAEMLWSVWIDKGTLPPRKLYFAFMQRLALSYGLLWPSNFTSDEQDKDNIQEEEDEEWVASLDEDVPLPYVEAEVYEDDTEPHELELDRQMILWGISLCEQRFSKLFPEALRDTFLPEPDFTMWEHELPHRLELVGRWESFFENNIRPFYGDPWASPLSVEDVWQKRFADSEGLGKVVYFYLNAIVNEILTERMGAFPQYVVDMYLCTQMLGHLWNASLTTMDLEESMLEFADSLSSLIEALGDNDIPMDADMRRSLENIIENPIMEQFEATHEAIQTLLERTEVIIRQKMEVPYTASNKMRDVVIPLLLQEVEPVDEFHGELLENLRHAALSAVDALARD